VVDGRPIYGVQSARFLSARVTALRLAYDMSCSSACLSSVVCDVQTEPEVQYGLQPTGIYTEGKFAEGHEATS